MKRAVLTVIALILLGGDSMIPGQEKTSALSGVIDFHTHSGPDSRPRSVNDIEAARQAAAAGVRGLVFKNHFTVTADRAALAMSEVSDIEIFGGA